MNEIDEVNIDWENGERIWEEDLPGEPVGFQYAPQHLLPIYAAVWVRNQWLQQPHRPRIEICEGNVAFEILRYLVGGQNFIINHREWSPSQAVVTPDFIRKKIDHVILHYGRNQWELDPLLAGEISTLFVIELKDGLNTGEHARFRATIELLKRIVLIVRSNMEPTDGDGINIDGVLIQATGNHARYFGWYVDEDGQVHVYDIVHPGEAVSTGDPLLWDRPFLGPGALTARLIARFKHRYGLGDLFAGANNAENNMED